MNTFHAVESRPTGTYASFLLPSLMASIFHICLYLTSRGAGKGRGYDPVGRVSGLYDISEVNIRSHSSRKTMTAAMEECTQ